MKLYPLTYSQKNIWYTEKAHPGTSIGNVAGTLRMKTDVDFNLLEKAINKFVEINENNIDVIVSNPPYIRSKETVDPQTLKYEPHLALFAEPVTMFYEEILTSIDRQLMNDNKFLIAFEIGEDMESELTKLVEEKYPGIMYRFDKDIYNKTRFLYIVNNKELTDALN